MIERGRSRCRAMGRSFSLSPFGIGVGNSQGTLLPYGLAPANAKMHMSTTVRFYKHNLSVEDNNAAF